METIDFEKNFYEKTIKNFETKKLTHNDLQKAQIMLQIIENNKNFYKKQAEVMESINAFDNLKHILNKHHISILGDFEDVEIKKPEFCDEEIKLNDFLKCLTLPNPKKQHKNEEILLELKKFLEFSKEKNASHIFLLRDMFLCFLKSKKMNQNSYPLLFGRKMLKFFISKESNDCFDFNESDDDEIYTKFLGIMFDGASLYPKSFQKFFSYIKPKFLKILKQHKELYTFLKDYISQIKSKKIIVLESGLYGTMPLILKCIDARVDFRLFATRPEFYDIYKKRVFQKSLEKLVSLEKLSSQNEFFVFSSVKNNEVMIKQVKDSKIKNNSLEEISYFLHL